MESEPQPTCTGRSLIGRTTIWRAAPSHRRDAPMSKRAMVTRMVTRSDICPDDMQRYRGLIANIEFSDTQKDEVIHIVSCMMQAFVDQAFGVDPVQISQRQRVSDSFNESSGCANLSKPDAGEKFDHLTGGRAGEVGLQG